MRLSGDPADLNAEPQGALRLADEDATARFGATLARVLAPGDAVLLSGDLGAGKTALARSAIQSLLPTYEDVPSPTFTLAQIYEAASPIWHADLYRVNDPDEIVEIGLADAFDDAIVFVEWPDRLGPYAPRRALSLTLAYGEPDGRVVAWTASGGDWAAVTCALEAFE